METLRFDSLTHAILRIGVGLLFLQHGLQKVFGMFGGEAVPLGSMMGVAGLLELVGGVMLIAGLLTRPVGAVLAIEMLAAYFMAHQPQGGMPVQNGGELALLFALTFVFLAGHGAGPLSVDGAIARARARRDVEAEDFRRAA
ncbi:MAG: DoxX family protein [Candidatus Rokubacteria bacterium]|nr:DoxX family protein [Candidatus Rokubacteria bacterium]